MEIQQTYPQHESEKIFFELDTEELMSLMDFFYDFQEVTLLSETSTQKTFSVYAPYIAQEKIIRVQFEFVLEEGKGLHYLSVLEEEKPPISLGHFYKLIFETEDGDDYGEIHDNEFEQDSKLNTLIAANLFDETIAKEYITTLLLKKCIEFKGDEEDMEEFFWFDSRRHDFSLIRYFYSSWSNALKETKLKYEQLQ